MLLKVWYLLFFCYKTRGTPSALEKETVLILYAPYLFLSWLSESHKHLPAPEAPVVIPAMCSQTKGRMDAEHSIWLLMMLLKLRKINFVSDWGNEKKKGRMRWNTYCELLNDIVRHQYVTEGKGFHVRDTLPAWSVLLLSADSCWDNKSEILWLQHNDMVPELLSHLALIWESLHHTWLHGKDKTMADWLQKLCQELHQWSSVIPLL